MVSKKTVVGNQPTTVILQKAKKNEQSTTVVSKKTVVGDQPTTVNWEERIILVHDRELKEYEKY